MSKKHPHSGLIRLWSDTWYEECEVWSKHNSEEKWTQPKNPMWYPNTKYRVIHDDYKEAWQAWLDGELQVLTCSDDSEWKDMPEEPIFVFAPDRYRRKPKIQRYELGVDKANSYTIAWPSMVRDDQGEYVRYEDIKHLL